MRRQSGHRHRIHDCSGFGPQLSLSYVSGSGNGPFGLGWNLSLPSITRKTDKGLPKTWELFIPDSLLLTLRELNGK
ncbi:MAG: hypothetical protein JRE64_00935 [Deltaproteobacteria bacterium]|nr:hypothetical protein [Deltaproteobacteria bacterium]